MKCAALLYTIYICFSIGINLTAESNKGQLDAYVKNGEWDLAGKTNSLFNT
jgi:hypothetical protein